MWFPRPRGDGPAGLVAALVSEQVPPPTRGWPGMERPRIQSRAGSPAHAGMARLARLEGGGRQGFPRPRGDGPVRTKDLVSAALVPPPTRGWPGDALLAWHRRAGSPAHAGMAPCRSSRLAGASGFPRPRGDGPPQVRMERLT